ncbi:IE-1 [Agrotis ipsilon multiple nucleopolyhedrovirus]|uniref:IE-1 n=1 Tax=Agrotis ipsilon multiple nucleopolyhedrovirus TaxID=208013 RepID=B6D667_9ABAC|nr:IE-1 [Agrotis ipsilon multiple nucleopolyhedrovirus]ACI28854.1 IE-1 [Agrotis ipsilon multiple nucleopolyhedrovirus]
MHAPQPNYYAYKNQHGIRTPTREDLGSYLKFKPIPNAPKAVDQNLNTQAYELQYKSLMNTVDHINSVVAENFEVNTQDINQNLDLSFIDAINNDSIKPEDLVVNEGKLIVTEIPTRTTTLPTPPTSPPTKTYKGKGLGKGKGFGKGKVLYMKKRSYDTMNADDSDDDDEEEEEESESENETVPTAPIGKNRKNYAQSTPSASTSSSSLPLPLPSTSSSPESVSRTIIKPKTRGRYAKKMCVSSALKPVHVSKPSIGDPATEMLFRDIILDQQQSDERPENNRRFASHMLDTSHYMFIVTRPINADAKEKFTLQYINYVHSVYNEYTAHYMHHDRFVLVVTFERYRFMISYHLLLDLGVDIPLQDQFSEKKLADNNKNMCFFEEVKDFEFLSLLTNLFGLDKVYVQGKISLLLASIGEHKARSIHEHLTEMIADKSLFTLPFHMHKKEANPEELAKYDMSLYVEDIMKATNGLRFKTLPPLNFNKEYTRAEVLQGLAQLLSPWYNLKEPKDPKDKNSFTYKYGCIARQFYNTDDKGVNKLFKIKKESGSARLIENYLTACKERLDNHSFILVTTKSDERITIVKKGLEFLWITSVIKDIVVADLVKKYRRYNHYIFNLNTGNRKEINIRHNGMIKLLAYYTGGLITREELKSIACTKFECNFDYILYEKTKAKLSS